MEGPDSLMRSYPYDSKTAGNRRERLPGSMTAPPDLSSLSWDLAIIARSRRGLADEPRSYIDQSGRGDQCISELARFTHLSIRLRGACGYAAGDLRTPRRPESE